LGVPGGVQVGEDGMGALGDGGDDAREETPESSCCTVHACNSRCGCCRCCCGGVGGGGCRGGAGGVRWQVGEDGVGAVGDDGRDAPREELRGARGVVDRVHYRGHPPRHRPDLLLGSGVVVEVERKAVQPRDDAFPVVGNRTNQ